MNAPEPQGKEVDIHMFVDSNHKEIRYLTDQEVAS